LGKFITFEGIEGSGKTTQIKRVADYLAGENFQLVITQEPSGTDIGAKISDILFHREHVAMCPETELFLFCAARAQHVREVILPALKKGKIVLCDRFSDATYAYQGAGRGLDENFIRMINDFSALNLKPDMTLLFDLPVETGLTRATQRNNRLDKPSMMDRFEKETLDFHQRIRDGYLERMKQEPERFRRIDATRDIHAVQQDVQACIVEVIRRNH